MNHSQTGQATLADILRLVLPLDTKFTGADPAGFLVHWVMVLTRIEQLSDQVQANDIVIMPPTLQEQVDEETLVKAIPELAAVAAAALLTFHKLPEQAVRAATECDLPLMVVTGNITVRDVHQGIAGLLVDRQKQINERGMQLYRRLTEMSREGKGLAAMTEVMSRLTGKIVAVQDKRLEIQALTIPEGSQLDEQSVLDALQRRENLPSLLRNRKLVASVSRSHWQQQLTIDGMEFDHIIGPIISGDMARGYVSLLGLPGEHDQLDVLTVEHGAAACALEMAKAKAISETRKELRGDLLEGLLAGTLPQEEIQRLAGRLGHDTNRPHAIMSLAWDGENRPSLRRLETPIHGLLSDPNRPFITHIYSTDHVCLFQALNKQDKDLKAADELAQHLRQLLLEEFPEKRLLIGLSGPAASLDQWPEIYRQAVQAMELARRLQLDTPVNFNELGVYQLLIQLESLPAVHRFCDKIIGPLAAYDEKHGSSLVQTLDAYFSRHGNISQTAETLFIHRNTLHYRLERIRELTGQDLEQADKRLALQLALKLWQLRPD